MAHDIFENRKQFQLERLILFSDAVFAIAITLLVLEIRIPKSDWSKPIGVRQLDGYLIEIIPNILGFAVSFFFIGFYWTIHHRIFGYVINFDARLIWLNLLMLFFIALLPFTTTLTSEYGYLNKTFIYYWLNVGFIGLVSFFIQLHIGNPSKKLSVGLEDARLRHYALAGALFTSAIFFLGAIMAMSGNTFLQFAAKYIYVLIFPGMVVLKKVYKVKHKTPHSTK
jgi:uncharacterized membrane protein